MQAVRGLNHLTLAVTDLERSVLFYRDVLGFRLRARWAAGAYLDAGGLWLCLSLDAAARTAPHPDYTHVAFDVGADDFTRLSDRLRAAPVWRDNRSEGQSLYVLDPDRHKLELACRFTGEPTGSLPRKPQARPHHHRPVREGRDRPPRSVNGPGLPAAEAPRCW